MTDAALPPTMKKHEYPCRLLKAFQEFNIEICTETLQPEYMHVFKMCVQVKVNLRLHVAYERIFKRRPQWLNASFNC